MAQVADLDFLNPGVKSNRSKDDERYFNKKTIYWEFPNGVLTQKNNAPGHIDEVFLRTRIAISSKTS